MTDLPKSEFSPEAVEVRAHDPIDPPRWLTSDTLDGRVRSEPLPVAIARRDSGGRRTP